MAADLTERQKFDAWCERNHYHREGLRVYDGPSWDRRLRVSYPPKDLDLAWEAWQEAVAGVTTCAPPGWKLVPEQPTKEMLNTWALRMPEPVFSGIPPGPQTQVLGWSAVDAIYRDMLAAAPQPPHGVIASETGQEKKHG